MLRPLDPQTASSWVDSYRPARSAGPRPASSPRRRLGRLLVALGARIAGEAAPSLRPRLP